MYPHVLSEKRSGKWSYWWDCSFPVSLSQHSSLGPYSFLILYRKGLAIAAAVGILSTSVALFHMRTLLKLGFYFPFRSFCSIFPSCCMLMEVSYPVTVKLIFCNKNDPWVRRLGFGSCYRERFPLWSWTNHLIFIISKLYSFHECW